LKKWEKTFGTLTPEKVNENLGKIQDYLVKVLREEV
jgi:hypothetical protein